MLVDDVDGVAWRRDNERLHIKGAVGIMLRGLPSSPSSRVA